MPCPEGERRKTSKKSVSKFGPMLLVSILVTCQFVGCFSSETTSTHQTSTVYSREASSEVFIGNDFLEIGFRKDYGAISSFIHKASGTDLIAVKTDVQGLWDVQLLTQDLRTICPSGVYRSRPYYVGYSLNQTENEITIELEWTKIWLEGYGEYPARLLVQARVNGSSPEARFSIEIQNSGPFAVETVVLPILWEVSKLGNQSSDDRLLFPSQNGRLFQNPIQNLQWYGNYYPSGFLNMQFMAYYDSNAGFYFATYDSNGNTKFFFWQRLDSTSANIGIIHYPAISFGADFSLSYDVIVGVFTGDWYTAADIYKEWAYKQWWSIKKETPAWLREIAVGKDFICYWSSPEWYRNRTFTEVIEKIEQNQEYFHLPALIFLWGWEHQSAWSWGDYFPPYEGWQNFDDLVKTAHESDSKLWMVIRAAGIITESEPWKNGTAEDYAITNRDGSYKIDPPEFGVPWPTVTMCPSTDYWRETLKSYVLTLVDHGVDLIQFDGFPWIPPQPCYNASHGHPLGLGGNWYANAWINTLGEIEGEARKINPEIAFSGEGGCELFLPFQDVYHSRDNWAEFADPDFQNQSVSVVPLFNYVYSDRITLVGEHNFALWNPLGASSYNRLGFARILTWGEIGSYNMQEDLYDPNVDRITLDYVKKIGYARSAYLHSFLVNSTMIKPEEIASPTILVRAETGQYFSVSALQYSAWKPNGAHCIGYVLTNIGTSDIQINQAFEVPLSLPYNVYLFRDGKLEQTETITDKSYALNFTVKPLDIILLAFGNLHQAWMKADLNFDGVVNILDISIVAKAFGTRPGDQRWDAVADVNGDDTVNILDISMIARDYGKSAFGEL
jgi:hypothetical protein